MQVANNHSKLNLNTCFFLSETKTKLDKLVAMAKEEEAKAEEKRKLILEEQKRVEEARKKILEEKGANKDTVSNKEENGNATVASSAENKVEGDKGEEKLNEQVAAPDNTDESTEGATDMEGDEGGNGKQDENEGEGDGAANEEAGDDIEEEEEEEDEKGDRSPPGEDQESSFEPAKFNLMTGSSSSSAASVGSADTR